MKQQPLLLSILGAAALLSITGYAQKTQESETLEERVQELEQALEGMQGILDGLADASADDASTLDTITIYLQEQARSAKSMTSTLAEAEKLGFVAGINHGSRTALLSGWRSQLQAQQTGLPGAPPVKEEPKKRWDR